MIKSEGLMLNDEGCWMTCIYFFIIKIVFIWENAEEEKQNICCVFLTTKYLHFAKDYSNVIKRYLAFYKFLLVCEVIIMIIMNAVVTLLKYTCNCWKLPEGYLIHRMTFNINYVKWLLFKQSVLFLFFLSESITLYPTFIKINSEIFLQSMNL